MNEKKNNEKNANRNKRQAHPTTLFIKKKLNKKIPTQMFFK